MPVEELLENPYMMSVLWNRRIELPDGQAFNNLEEYLKTTNEGREYLAKKRS